MWLFRRKNKKSWLETETDKLKEFCNIGETFSYLGRTLVVKGYTELGIGTFLPRLVCDYADEKGVIHTITFKVSELEALKK